MTESANAPRRGISRGAFFRWCRDWHGYLSAAAFVSLIFFSATGILLNHPGMLEGEGDPGQTITLRLDAGETERIRAAGEPGRALAETVAARQAIVGDYRSGETAGEDVYATLQGARGRSDLSANLSTGDVEVYVQKESAIGVLNALHRGEHAGAAWRFFIDVMAGVFIALSLIGLALFLSLRFRLRTAMILMAGSVAVMIALFVFAVA